MRPYRIGKKPKLALIRGAKGMEAKFYSAFKRFDVSFIYAGKKQNFSHFKPKNNNIEFINLPLKPAFFIDPIKIMTGDYNNRSWTTYDGVYRYLDKSDVICLVDTFYVINYFVAKFARKKGIPLVTMIWETIPNHISTFIPPYCLSVKEVVSATSLFFLRSKLAKNYTDSLDIFPEKTKVVYMGLDLDMFHPVNKSENKSFNRDIKILYVGRLEVSKGVEDLLKVFFRLCLEFKNVKLVVAGQGRLSEEIKGLSKNYPIEYLGFVDYAELPKVYQKADIFCSPSKDIKYFGFKTWQEHFSFTLMEAQASGLPIVATRCGANQEEVGEKNFFVDQGDTEGLYSALKDIIMYKKKRWEIGKLNRKRAEKLFDVRNQARETEEAIFNAVK